MLHGLSHPAKKEIISFDEFVQDFTLERMQKTGPVFDIEKLNWMNGKYIREILSEQELVSKLVPFVAEDFPMEKMQQILPLIRERLVTLMDFNELTSFFYQDFEIDTDLLLKKGTPELVTQQLQSVIQVIENIKPWQLSEIESQLRALQEKNDWKKSQFFMMVRVAVTGRKATPPLFETIEVIGQAVTLDRLQKALAQISE